MPSKRRSSLKFGSLLVYAVGGDRTAEATRKNHEVTAAIKNDAPIFENELGPDYLARVFLDRCKGTDLDGFVPPDATLIPLPRSSPLPKGASWPALRIAEALLAQGVGTRVEKLLVREEATLSSSRDRGIRNPERHYETTGAQNLDLFSPAPMVLIDDVIGSGATALGMAWRLDEVIPSLDLRLLAISRVVTNQVEPVALLAPVIGEIRHQPLNGRSSRSP